MRRILIAGIATLAISTVAQTKEEEIRGATDLELQKAINQLRTNAPTPEIQKAAERLDEAYKSTKIYEHQLKEAAVDAANVEYTASVKEKSTKGASPRRKTAVEHAKAAAEEHEAAAKEKYKTQLSELKKEADNFAATVRNAPPKLEFKQSVFQCLDDFNICIIRGENTTNTCVAMLIICAARTLIPGTS